MHTLAACLLAAFAAEVEMPRVLDDRLQLQLVASDPDIVTPTGIGVDSKGRVFVIESNTHFPPPDYKRAKHDRILLLEDFGPDGKAQKVGVFFEGTKFTMNLAVYHDGSLYVATRYEVFRLTDKDGDGKADQSLEERQKIAWLDTKGDYPHNGLSGFAFDLAGSIYFGFGENLGADYKLIGTDGTTLTGGGEGGNIYCCSSEGKYLRRMATGFWNPFHVGFDAFGRLFAVDNDPDSRPPCRLLHIVEGGDYGYRYRNGRKGVHPFTAWNGELPGTLPMVAGTGEAPCAVVAYESDNLPEEYRGDLLVTSWGDHRIERYKLKPRGASFSAEMQPVVRGDENFRPVGMALAPDGSLYFSDWVDKSYTLHGKGRVWRLSAKNPPQPNRPEDTIEALSSPHGPWREVAARKLSADEARSVAAAVRNPRAAYLVAHRALEKQPADVANKLARVLAAENMLRKTNWLSEIPQENEPVEPVRGAKLGNESIADLVSIARPHPAHVTQVFEPPDPFMQHAAVRFWLRYAKSNPEEFERQFITKTETGLTGIGFRPKEFPDRMAWAIVARRSGNPRIERLLPIMLLLDDDPKIQLFGIIWSAESRNNELRPELEKLLATAKTRVIFEATLAALELLDGKKSRNPSEELGGDVYVLQLLKSEKTSPEVRRFALRMLRPEHEQLTVDLLTKLVRDADEGVRLEAIRTLRARPDSERWQELREIAADEKAPVQHRCEAILGLSPGNKTDRELLLKLAESEVPAVSDEALRALRGFDLTRGEIDRLNSLAEKLDGPHRELARRAIDRNPPKNLPKGTDLATWLTVTEGEGDPNAGERIFYHARVGGCFRCHEYEGRGYTVGPDLSPTGKALSRERLLESIVNPSKEIAPMFTNWTILKTDGELLTGIHVGDEVDGRIRYADQDGRVFHVHPNDIDQRKPSEKSIKPDSLADNLTPQELRDLLAFLMKR
jgi:putative membrane-bound dehydrogenase-like protein